MVFSIEVLQSDCYDNVLDDVFVNNRATAPALMKYSLNLTFSHLSDFFLKISVIY